MRTGWCLTLDEDILSLLRLLASCWLMSKPRIGLLLPSFAAWPCIYVWFRQHCCVNEQKKNVLSKDAAWGNWGHNIPLLLKSAISVCRFSEYFFLWAVFIDRCVLGEIRPILLSYMAVNNVQACHGVDWAHTDGGLLSPLSCPSCLWTKPRWREGNVGPGEGEHSCHSATHNLRTPTHRRRHLWLEIPFEPHSETEGVCVRKSEEKSRVICKSATFSNTGFNYPGQK